MIIYTMDGKERGDTIYHTIPDFSFVDQDSNFVTNETFRGKIYSWIFSLRDALPSVPS